jgi:hypothetical protein
MSASSSRKELHIFIPPISSFEGSKPIYRLLGSTFRRACTIIKGDSIVAQVIWNNCVSKIRSMLFAVTLTIFDQCSLQ